MRGWLRAKANSIEGGSSEINLNVVSKRVLGLPDPKYATETRSAPATNLNLGEI